MFDYVAFMQVIVKDGTKGPDVSGWMVAVHVPKFGCKA
jgi:hypothetical protein